MRQSASPIRLLASKTHVQFSHRRVSVLKLRQLSMYSTQQVIQDCLSLVRDLSVLDRTAIKRLREALPLDVPEALKSSLVILITSSCFSYHPLNGESVYRRKRASSGADFIEESRRMHSFIQAFIQSLPSDASPSTHKGLFI